MSLIEEGYEQQVRMAYLAIVGSISVNGVAELHSELLKQGLFRISTNCGRRSSTTRQRRHQRAGWPIAIPASTR